MYNTMEEVFDNEYLRALVRNCNRYDLPGVFIEHNLDIQSKESGIYFVTGIDRQKIYEMKYNPAELLIQQNINSFFFQPIKVFKITNEDPACVSSDVEEYLWSAEFVDKVFPQFQIYSPEKVPMATIYNLGILYRKTHSDEYNQFLQSQYMGLFRKKMAVLQTVLTQKGFKKKYKDYEWSNKFDGRRSYPVNFVLFFFRNLYKQRISHNLMMHRFGNVTSSIIEKNDCKKLIKELKKYPNIIYYIDKKTIYKDTCRSKVYKEIFEITNGDNSYITRKPAKYPYKRICFPEKMAPIIFKAYNDIVYGHEAPITADEIINSGHPYDAVVVSTTTLDEYSLCFKACNMPFAIDTGYVNHPSRAKVPLLYYKEHKENVEEIEMYLAAQVGKFHEVANTKHTVEIYYSEKGGEEKLPIKTSKIRESPEMFNENESLEIHDEYEYEY